MNKLVTVIFSILFAGSNLVYSADFDDWDTDGDGLLEHHEFTSKFMDKYFNSWDPSGTEGILEEGFFKKSYAGLDTDNDNLLSDEEWLLGYNYFYDDYVVYDDIDFVDVDDNGNITYTEYYDALYETTYFTDIDLDADNYISEYELANYVFDNWDTNDSGILSRSEFNRFSWYYLDV